MREARIYSESEVQRLVGPAAFGRATSVQREGLVAEARWNRDRTAITGRVRGTNPLPYAVRVGLRVDPDGPHPVTGFCNCPIGDRCKHVGAVLLEALRRPEAPATGGAATTTAAAEASTGAWRRALDPILEGLGPNEAATALGLQFELQSDESSRPMPGRFARSPKRRAVPVVAVRPVQLGARGRWRRTGITWRDVAFGAVLHEFDDAQVGAIRALQVLLIGAQNPYATDTWLHLDQVRSAALWSHLRDAERAGVALVTGGRRQLPLVVSSTPATPAIDISRTPDGLVLRPLVALGPADAGPDAGAEIALLGDPAVGIATWPEYEEGELPAERALTLAPFARPLASSARGLLRSDEPIVIPVDEEQAFLVEHHRRLAAVFALVSRDGSFEAPPPPVATLGLTLRHSAGAALEGTWWWHYRVPRSVQEPDAGSGADADPDSTEDPDVEATLPAVDARVPLDAEGDRRYRDPDQERRLLESLGETGIGPASVPLLYAAGARLHPHFETTGMDTVAFLRDTLPQLRRVPGLELEEPGEVVEFRAAEQAPVVEVGTSDRAGERDWFDLDIEVRVGDETVPMADLILALARGDDMMVLPGGVYFPLDDPVFLRLRDLIGEARELTDSTGPTLRISRFQASLWDELAELGVVTRQADAWRRAVGGLTGLGADGALEHQALPDDFQATLRPYQQAGYDWLAFLYDNRLGGVLADDMGLGKTVQALALVARAVQQADAGEGTDGAAPETPVRPRFLVVAPTSVVPNWLAEAKRFAPSLRTAGVTETTRKSGRALADTVGDADLVVTSYALLRLDAEAYGELDWAGLLLDEAQFVKNRQAATYSRVRALDVPFKLAITGTPMENNLMELWSILSITAPGLFPSPQGFQEFYQRPIEREGDADRLAQLRRRIRPLMLRRRKDLVASELPPKLEQTVEVELAPKQRAVYDRYLARERQRVLGLIDEFDRNRFAIFRALAVLRQVALDAALVDPAYEGVPSTKLDLLDELLEDALAEGHRVLVFSQFTRLLARARARLDAAGVEYAYLDGSTTRRGEVVERFRSGAAGVFLISLKAGGFGMNLAEADYCILLDPWWNPAAEAQAVDRAHRIGQTRPVHVYRLVAKNTIEEKVMALKAQKAELFAAVMDADAGTSSTGISADDVRELLG